ncbi:MAG: hypothetical protein OXI93_03400, partial [Bryobacterales bacterium]|nr:hypothetical protein [Bryobacterales bacterium]
MIAATFFGTPEACAGINLELIAAAPIAKPEEIKVLRFTVRAFPFENPDGMWSLIRKSVSLYFSPRGEAKCVRGPPGRGAS